MSHRTPKASASPSMDGGRGADRYRGPSLESDQTESALAVRKSWDLLNQANVTGHRATRPGPQMARSMYRRFGTASFAIPSSVHQNTIKILVYVETGQGQPESHEERQEEQIRAQRRRYHRPRQRAGGYRALAPAPLSRRKIRLVSRLLKMGRKMKVASAKETESRSSVLPPIPARHPMHRNGVQLSLLGSLRGSAGTAPGIRASRIRLLAVMVSLNC